MIKSCASVRGMLYDQREEGPWAPQRRRESFYRLPLNCSVRSSLSMEGQKSQFSQTTLQHVRTCTLAVSRQCPTQSRFSPFLAKPHDKEVNTKLFGMKEFTFFIAAHPPSKLWHLASSLNALPITLLRGTPEALSPIQDLNQVSVNITDSGLDPHIVFGLELEFVVFTPTWFSDPNPG